MRKTGASYQININHPDMQAVREALADLIDGIDQMTPHGHEGDFVFVDSTDVGEAVARINALGYTTDEDEDDNQE